MWVKTHCQWKVRASVSIDTSCPVISLLEHDTKLWHPRLECINNKDLVNAHKFADDVSELMPNDDVCWACQLGKAQKLPFSGNFRRASTVGEAVNSDIVGKLNISDPDRYQFVCTFLDDHSRYTHLAFLRRKRAVHNEFHKTFMKMQFSSNDSISVLQSPRIMGFNSDGGEEYEKLEIAYGGNEWY